MRTWVTAATVMVWTLAFSALAQHEHGSDLRAGKTIEVQGEVVCLHCYQESGTRGPGHLACAEKCYAEGHPLGLVDEGGNLYRLEPGEKQGKTVKLANVGLHHALMCVNMPLEAVGIVTDREMPQLEAKVHGPAVALDADWLAREVKIKGQASAQGEERVLAVEAVRFLEPEAGAQDETPPNPPTGGETGQSQEGHSAHTHPAAHAER